MCEPFRRLPFAALLSTVCLVCAGLAHAATTPSSPAPLGADRQLLPTGQWITPTAAPGSQYTLLNPHLPDTPNYVAGQPISEALSPDRTTLLVLTSGYNRRIDDQGRGIADSNEYVFVFDVSAGAARATQVLEVPNTYVGVAFAPSGNLFVVAGGVDDCLYVFNRDRESGRWTADPRSPVKLRHQAGIGRVRRPMAQGVAVSADGAFAAVTNRYNASLTLVDLNRFEVEKEIELRPGKLDPKRAGVPGGEYPDAVVLTGQTAFVASERDREIDVVDFASAQVTARIALAGNPSKMIVSRDERRLFVALDNADTVAVIDTASRKITASIATVAPPALLHLSKSYRGASPDGLALSEDERTLYVSNRGTNSIAVIDLHQRDPQTIGLIPTAWYPSDVVVGPKARLYVVNTRSVPGPNPMNCQGIEAAPCVTERLRSGSKVNQYILALTKGGLLTVPVPDVSTLHALTRAVADNNRFDAIDTDAALMRQVRQHTKHVIYIIKENRTYDQVLGDLGRGDSDPKLAEFPQATTPNQHALARQFVLFDNFLVSGGVSGDGWPWSTAARESDDGAKMVPVYYGQRGGSYDFEGINSGINVGLSGEERLNAQPQLADPETGKADPDVLPGKGNVAAPDGPEGEQQQGYLWDAALRAGLRVRNYGFLIDLGRYGARLAITRPAAYIPPERDPHAKGLTVAYAANPELAGRTDPYFRGFDAAFPDTYREQEWEREFHEFVANGQLPELSLVRFMNDHTGSFGSAIAGVNTPERQVADNDFAVGKLVEAVAHSRYASDTLIFVVEDDAQDGADHVDAHRSVAFVVGPYVKQGAIEHNRYTTINLLRTITDVLGLDHLSLFDATQRPMSSIFDLRQSQWTFTAQASALLTAPDVTLDLSGAAHGVTASLQPTHDARYWAARTRGMDFDAEDRVDADRYNRILWRGLMGKQPYPKR